MAPEKAPAFQLYVKDWRSSRAVMRMTFAQRGMYLEMLLEQWESYSLPDDPTACAELIGGSVEEWAREWPVLRRKFVDRRKRARGDQYDDNGPHKRIVNLKLEEIRSEKKRFRKTARRGGLARASSATRGNNGTYSPAISPAGAPADDQQASRASTSSSSSSSSASSTASASASSSALTPRGRAGEPPLAMGLRRFRVWRWMLESFINRLGDHAEAFDLDAWLQALDLRDAALVPRDAWPWLDSEFIAECQRRGLAVAAPVVVAPTNKRIAGLVAGGNAFLNRSRS